MTAGVATAEVDVSLTVRSMLGERVSRFRHILQLFTRESYLFCVILVSHELNCLRNMDYLMMGIFVLKKEAAFSQTKILVSWIRRAALVRPALFQGHSARQIYPPNTRRLCQPVIEHARRIHFFSPIASSTKIGPK